MATFTAVMVSLVPFPGNAVLLSGIAPAEAADIGFLIRVGLGEARQTTVSAQGMHELVSLTTGQVIAVGLPGQQWILAPGPGVTTVPGVVPVTGPILVRPGAGSGYVQFKGRSYRGTLEVRPSAGGLTVINIVPLEEYLYGVVPREMPASWPAEALKAQAVAARSYAVFTRASGKYAGLGYDVVDTQESQVYGGVGAEDPRSTQAVDATRGLVLTYQGDVVQAFYHSSSGGHTEDSEFVWGGYRPYLRGVPDFDQASPRYRWTKDMSMSEVERLLRESGNDVGQVLRLEPAGPRGVSGRLSTVSVAGTTGVREVRATALRTILGLNSTLVEFQHQDERVEEVVRQRTLGDRVVIVGADGRSERFLWETPMVGASGRAAGGFLFSVISRERIPASLRITGGGWGHGVGMSQWGARALAEKGNSFKQILEYYYQGTDVQPLSAAEGDFAREHP